MGRLNPSHVHFILRLASDCPDLIPQNFYLRMLQNKNFPQEFPVVTLFPVSTMSGLRF